MTLVAIYQTLRADLLERVRRYSFLVVLLLTVFIAYLHVPPASAGYVVMRFGAYQGLYNSAWIGSLVALRTSLLLGLLGFYIIKDAIERDRVTGVGQIIATTPIGKLSYLFGKMLSNLAVLLAIVLAAIIASIILYFLRGQEGHLDIAAIVMPFIVVVVPHLFFTASAAVFFEVIPFLRHSLGNILYFIFYFFQLQQSVPSPGRMAASNLFAKLDLMGYFSVMSRIMLDVKNMDPRYTYGSLSYGIIAKQSEAKFFLWQGMDWTVLLPGRLTVIGVALLVLLAAAVFFDRFDSFQAPKIKKLRVKNSVVQSSEIAAAGILPIKNLSPMGAARLQFSVLRLVKSELFLMLKGVRIMWAAGAAGLWAVSLICPFEMLRQFIYPLLWIWPVVLWSSLGCRENKHGTEAMVFSCPHFMKHQFPAMLLSGMLVAVALGSGVCIRFLAAGDVPSLLAWGAGILFAPALALCLGVWSGSSRVFESIYLLLWYIGPLNKLPALDFIGAGEASAHMGISIYYYLISVLLVSTAYIGRRRQLEN